MIYAKVTPGTLVMKEIMHQSILKAHKGGILHSHKDGNQSPVLQHEWHIDNAPTMQEVLKPRATIRHKQEK